LFAENILIIMRPERTTYYCPGQRPGVNDEEFFILRPERATHYEKDIYSHIDVPFQGVS
jgi:hypothetical protein